MVQLYPSTSFGRGTAADKQNAIGAIANTDVYGQMTTQGSDPGLAIQKAFEAFDAADAVGATNGCGLKAIVLLTDNTIPYVARSGARACRTARRTRAPASAHRTPHATIAWGHTWRSPNTKEPQRATAAVLTTAMTTRPGRRP